jgi:hypothetical protein
MILIVFLIYRRYAEKPGGQAVESLTEGDVHHIRMMRGFANIEKAG